MRALIVFLALVLVLGGGLWLAGVFEPAPIDGPGGVEPTGGPGSDQPTNDTGGELATVDTSPDALPDLEETAFPKGTRVLVLARRKLPENLFTLQILGAPDEVSYQSWFLNAGADTAAGKARGLDQLTTMPTAEHLEDADITLLVLDNVDPNDMPETFWEQVKERVGLGAMGLLVQAYPPYSPADPAAKVHPLLTHPVTKTFIPVAEALPLEGAPNEAGNMKIPGVFAGTPRPLVVTEDGQRHPAVRLVRWPKWNREWWGVLGSGDARIATPFCYPVTKTEAGSQVLLGALPKEGDALPAIIVGPENVGRVIWAGVPQLGWKFHYDNLSKKNVGTLLHNVLAWLAGGQPEAMETE